MLISTEQKHDQRFKRGYGLRDPTPVPRLGLQLHSKFASTALAEKQTAEKNVWSLPWAKGQNFIQDCQHT